MTSFHQLAPPSFEAVAAGRGGPEAISELHAAQVSKRLLLIAHLLDNWPGDRGELDIVIDLLDRSREAAPSAFREVVGAPMVGAWSGIAVRALERGAAVHDDFAHLAAIAVTAAAAAGVSGATRLPVHDGLVVLPGWGAAEVGDAESAEATIDAGQVTVRAIGAGGGTAIPVPADPQSASPRWLPVRDLVASAAGLRIRLQLDDLHPYRHGHHVPPAPRLSADDVSRWRSEFETGWTLLAECVPDRAAELGAGLRVLVPLRESDDGSARSATIRHAFGVFGLTRPPTPAEFAVTMIHEFQHSKLSALLDLVRLTDPGDDGRYFAPWRIDPRPLAGLLQGVYAFAGVADTWRALRGVSGLEKVAEREFAQARLQVDRGLTSVERSGALTPDGETLAGHLRVATEDMLAESLDPQVAQTAEDDLEAIFGAWSRRNQI
jgi:uncharacterized protein